LLSLKVLVDTFLGRLFEILITSHASFPSCPIEYRKTQNWLAGPRFAKEKAVSSKTSTDFWVIGWFSFVIFFGW